MADTINEKTKLAVPLTSWWHLVILVGTIIWWGAAIKASIDSTHEAAERALQQGSANDTEIRHLEMTVQQIKDQVDYMSPVVRRYIDEPAKK